MAAILGKFGHIMGTQPIVKYISNTLKTIDLA